MPLNKVEAAIHRMVGVLRGEAPPRNTKGRGWWVLAVGEELDMGNFLHREGARDRLYRQVLDAGVRLVECVWVWDETARAQLVIMTMPTRKRADAVAERLRSKGLEIRITREQPPEVE